MSKRAKLLPLPLVPGDRLTLCLVCNQNGGRKHLAVCHAKAKLGGWCHYNRPSVSAACGLRFCTVDHVAQHHEWCESYESLLAERVGGGC